MLVLVNDEPLTPVLLIETTVPKGKGNLSNIFGWWPDKWYNGVSGLDKLFGVQLWI